MESARRTACTSTCALTALTNYVNAGPDIRTQEVHIRPGCDACSVCTDFTEQYSEYISTVQPLSSLHRRRS
jgi:hypothetical protein